MKLTNTVVVLALTCGAAWAQNGPVIIQGAKANVNAAQQAQHSSVKVVSAAAQASKPAAAAKPASAAAAKSPVAKPVPAAAAKVPVAKPVPAVAAKAPVAKPEAQPVKANAGQAKAGVPSVPKKVAAQAKAPAAKSAARVSVKAAPTAETKKTPVKAVKAKAEPSKPAAQQPEKAEDVSVEKTPETEKSEKSTRTITANGRRDPFVSPVISQSAVGSGCSSGKRCLAVEQINLKGVVRSETGMIAVVVNALDKAYFLRENDPVFDGYVLKITGDSIVFKETVQDKLGKPFTKEVTKKISAPSV